jgi:hypothetical protein
MKLELLKLSLQLKIALIQGIMNEIDEVMVKPEYLHEAAITRFEGILIETRLNT